MPYEFTTELEELKVLAMWGITNLADGVFLVIWTYIQWEVNQVISGLQLDGIDYWLLMAIQLLFAVATFVPILTHICVGIVRRLVQALIVIRNELKRLKNPED